jgi:hypothetical protein
MRDLMSKCGLLFCIILILAQEVKPQDKAIGNAAIGLGAVIGGVYAADAVMREALDPQESVQWKNDQINSTVQLSEQCGLLVETKVYSALPHYSIFVGLKNISKESLQIKSNDAQIDYDKKLVRYFDQDIHRNFVIDPGSTVALQFKIHRKTDFKAKQSFSFNFPVSSSKGECSFQSNYTASTSYIPDEDKTSDSEILNMAAYFGSSQWSDSITDILDDRSGSTVSLEFNFFSSQKNGYFLDLNTSSNDLSSAYKAKNNLIKQENLVFNSMDIGYQYRNVFSEQNNLTLKFGVAFANFRSGGNQSTFSESAQATMPTLGFRYNYIFENIERGRLYGKYSVGLGSQLYYANDLAFDSSKKNAMIAQYLLGFTIGF